MPRYRWPLAWGAGLAALVTPITALQEFDLLALLALLLALLAGLVLIVWPAIWSQKRRRQDAALAVLDRLLRSRANKQP